jgi:hypothetical protein
MSDKVIATLARMAARGTLEVEHVLRTARQPSPRLADALDELALAMDWPRAPSFPQVPLGTWAEVVGVYCRDGHAGLLETANEPSMLPFVLGVLEELKTSEALSTLVRLVETHRDRLLSSPEPAGQIAAALNLASMNSPRGGPSESERGAGRDFLHDALTRADADNHRVTVLCALRYFGDETSLPLISNCPPLPPHWEPARGAAIRQIRRSMKQRAKSR